MSTNDAPGAAGPSGSTATYHCVVGHEIAAGHMDLLTEVWSLDTGAMVRACREHGAPIVGHASPGSEGALAALTLGS